MEQLFRLLLVIIVFGLILTFFKEGSKETFVNPRTQNFVYTNFQDVADQQEYGEEEMPAAALAKSDRPQGPSSWYGVNQNSNADVFDDRGFKWTAPSKDPLIDVITDSYDAKELRRKFDRMYMLDPKGTVAKYDITYNTISPNCCPAQYAPPFKLTGKGKTNCDYAQNYVANQYSGQNFNDGFGCTCMTADQAKFYGNRGNNTE